MRAPKRWLKRLVPWALGVGIRTKIMGIALGLTLLLGLGVSLTLHTTFLRTLSEEIEEIAIDVAEDAVSDGTEALLTRNKFALRQLGDVLYHAHRDVRYVIFRDVSGAVLAHTFVDSVPADLLPLPALPRGQNFRVEVFDTDEGPIHEVTMRAMGGKAGYVQVGVTEDWLRERMRETTVQLLVVTLIVSLFGIGAAYLLTAILTKPVRELTEVTEAASREDFGRRARVIAEDEIGNLAKAFNMMCERLSRSREEIRRKERMRVHLLQKVISAQEDERKRVARELHDHASQQLTTVALQLKALENTTSPAEARDLARQLRELVAQTSEAVRGLAVELRPSLLDDLGFVAAIERHCQSFQDRFGLPVDLEVVGHWDHSLSPEVETTLYRICQEALTNAARHAEPTHVSVLLTRRPESAVAIVEDEGKGFDVDAVLTDPRAERHLGLFGMHERAALVGGKLTLESQPGEGTTVFVEIPCPTVADDSAAADRL